MNILLYGENTVCSTGVIVGDNNIYINYIIAVPAELEKVFVEENTVEFRVGDASDATGGGQMLAIRRL